VLSISPEALIAAVDASRKKAATKSLDVSLNELADMYDSGELEINPEYQRYFRWPASKQSQFIESLLLEMPVPPLFAIEMDEGRWELIDGLQRVSSYLHFRGLLNAVNLAEPSENLVGQARSIKKGETLELQGCDIVKELNGLKFDQLPAALQIRLKRSFLRVEVIRRGSDKHLQYHMFKRLNTGGEMLSDQEVRNCTIRLLGDTFNNFLIKLAKECDSFKTCIAGLTDEAVNQRQDEELVLRFFAFKNNFGTFRHDISPFLTDYMERVTDSTSPRHIVFDYNIEKTAFDRTFGLLAATLGDDSCRAHRGGRYIGGFSMHHFEAFSLGVAKVIDRVDLANQKHVTAIKVALEALTGR
jgi:hypothetical protein